MFQGLNMLSGGASGLSFLRILTGISKTLGIAKELMPVYREVRPIVQKVPILLGKLSNTRQQIREFNNNFSNINNDNFAEQDVILNNSNGPTFFQ